MLQFNIKIKVNINKIFCYFKHGGNQFHGFFEYELYFFSVLSSRHRKIWKVS